MKNLGNYVLAGMIGLGSLGIFGKNNAYSQNKNKPEIMSYLDIWGNKKNVEVSIGIINYSQEIDVLLEVEGDTINLECYKKPEINWNEAYAYFEIPLKVNRKWKRADQLYYNRNKVDSFNVFLKDEKGNFTNSNFQKVKHEDGYTGYESRRLND